MPKVVHFEMETKNPEQKIAFYEEVFGWKFTQFMDGYWVIQTGEEGEEGIGGGLMQATEEGLRTINTIQVTSLDDTLAKVVDNGGTITSENMEIPGVGIFAYCKDKEGLPFGVLQPNQ